MGAIRLFLALVVACDHWLTMAPQPLFIDVRAKLGFNAGYAVMFFYVISGFLITYTLSRNYPANLDGSLRFFRNRFVRIFSLYWPVAAVAIYTFPATFPRAPADIFTCLFLIGSDWRLSFADYPAAHWGAMLDGLHPAWTLGAELTFYLVAPLLMRSWKLGVALLALTFGTRACFVWHVGPGLHEPWTYYFAPSTFCFFLFGHFICRAGLRWDAFTANRKLAFMLLAASITTMALGNYDNFDSLRFWISILCFSAALPSIFAATKDLRLLNLMGNVSFSVYLIHILVFVWFGGLISKLAVSPLPRLSAYVSVLVALAFVLLAAVVAHSAETIVAYALRVALGIRSRLLRAPAE